MANETKLAVILHADVVGSTDLVQRDERIAHDRIQDVFHRLSEAISQRRGTTRELRGDALVAQFERASDAVLAATEFQDENSARSHEFSDGIVPELRIGIALGEVVIADGTVTGAGVVLAQRLEQLAEPGHIVVQGAISEAVPNRLPLRFDFLGERTLKGFERPVRAHAVARIADATVVSQQVLRPHEGSPSNGDGKSRISIAVLPFQNLNATGDDQDFLVDGLTEDLITALSRYRWFFVISSGSTFIHKGLKVDPMTVGADLGVEYVLSGTLRSAGTRVRLNVQLSELSTRNQVWNERYDRDLDDIFQLQDELTQSIAGQVEPELAATERNRASKHPVSTSVWEKFHRGMWHFSQTDDAERMKAKEYFVEAIETDPTFVQGTAALSQYLSMGVANEWFEDSAAAKSQAIDLGRRAVQLEHRNAYAHYALGRAIGLAGDWDRALAELRLAVELNPSFALAYEGLGEVLGHLQRHEEALVACETAIALSPHDPRLCYTLLRMTRANYLLGRDERAIDLAKRSIELHPKFLWPRLLLIAALAQLGRTSELRDALLSARAIWRELSLPFVEQRAAGIGRTMPARLREGLEKANI